MHPLSENILKWIPQQPPFRFVDGITEISEDNVIGFYTYREDEFFYRGHFPAKPLTPGVILTETMAQIGLVALGIYLFGKDIEERNENLRTTPTFVFTSSEVDFLRIVLPGETVTVKSEKIYFRLGKLKVKTQMFNVEGIEVCRGILSGMILKEKINF
ncbi:MAG: hydroxymyristoyl-ACP dehydratase [Bacteroidia bacterium]|nr:hydroxymyristoyl-ACP dehydratase [Bacteroidia bacterium]